MITPKVLLTGSYTADQISVNFIEESSFPDNPVFSDFIEKNWEICLKEAHKKGKKLWNAIHYRVNHFYFDNHNIFFETSEIDYKTRLGMREIIQNLPDLYYPKGLVVTSLMKTSDNKYVIGKVGNAFINSKYMLIGGGCVKDELNIDKGEDFFHTLFKEMSEEANLTSYDIESCLLNHIILSEEGSIVLVFNTELSINSHEVEKRFNASNDGDLESLVYVSPNQMSSYLKSMGGYKALLTDTIYNQDIRKSQFYSTFYQSSI
jgi:hypothetical protein